MARGKGEAREAGAVVEPHPGRAGAPYRIDVPRRQRAPRDHVVGGTWPTGDVATPAARYAQAVVLTLERELAARGWSQRELARRAGLSSRTIGYLIDGVTSPDLSTLAALETALGVELLPDDRLD